MLEASSSQRPASSRANSNLAAGSWKLVTDSGVAVLTHRLIVLIVMAVLVSGCAAGRSFRRGQEAARAGDWDAAVTHYTRALQANPDNAQYKIELERAMQNAAREYITRARDAEAKGDIDGALLAYRKAVEMDASNRLAAQKAVELERAIRERIEKSRPKPEIEKLRERARQQVPVLVPPTVSLPKVHFNNASLRDVLNHIAALSGINVTFDTQLFRDQPVTVSLENVTVEEALRQILSQSGHFYKVLNPTTIVVAQDTPQARQKYEELVVQTFYLSHADAQEVSQIINTVMRIPNMTVVPALFPNKTANSITVRATAAVVQVIEQLIRSNDKPRAEVVVDVQILEVNRTRLKQFGIDLSTYALNLIFSPELAPPNIAGAATAPPPFNLNTITQGISTADFYLGVPTAVFRFLENDGHTRLLAKPQLRGAEGRPMTLNLGQEIPVVSTVFGAPVSGGFASIPQSSFNYRPVGINMEVLPRVTYDGEIVLELTVENSALGPSIDVAGQSVPSFTSRKVQTKLRLREGESNLLAGLIREEDRRTISGIPGLIRVPLLNSLFANNNNSSDQSDIVMLLTPHIVRTHELTVSDLAPIYIGTQTNIGLGGPPPLIAPPPDDPAAAAAAAAAAATGVPQLPTPVGIPGAPPGGVPRPPAAAAPGAPTTTQPTPPGTATVPTPAGAATERPTFPLPGTTTPPGTTDPTAPPRDPTQPAAQPSAATQQPSTAAQIIVTTTSPEWRVSGGPYVVPISVNNAQRLSTMTLTVTYNPAVLRVRNVQEGTFMRQGAVTATFTPRIDAAAGRVDIAVVRTGDNAGASGAGLLAALMFDAVGEGNSLIQVSGVASSPEGVPLMLQFSPASVTVR
jgi:general secretion pathway protein D